MAPGEAVGTRQFTQYDAAGQVVATIAAGGGAAHGAGARDLVLSQGVVGYLAHPEALPSDAAGLAALAADPALLPSFVAVSNPITVNSYDAKGNLLSKTTGTQSGGTFLSGANKVVYQYDAFDRIVSVQTWQDGTSALALRTYDTYGNLVSLADGAGHMTTYEYGAFGRLLSKTVGEPSTQVWVHTRDGRLGQADGYGHFESQAGNQLVTNYAYSELNEQMLQTSSAGQQVSQRRDHAGHLLSTNDAANGVTFYSYDSYGNRVGEVFTGVATGSGIAAQTRSMRYTYDGWGRQTSWADAATGLSENYRYDPHSNLLGVSSSTGGGSVNANNGQFNPSNASAGAGAVSGEIGNAAPVSGSNVTGKAFDHVYVFNGNNQVTQMSESGAGAGAAQVLATYGHDAAGNMTVFTDVVNGTRTVYRYDSMGREVGAMMVGGSVN